MTYAATLATYLHNLKRRRSLLKCLSLLGLAMLIALTVRGQSVIEHSLSAARAAGAAKAASTTGKATASVFENSAKALRQAVQPSTAPASAKPARPVAGGAQPLASAAPEKRTEPAAVFEDAAAIEIGTTYDEVIRRFGDPHVKTTLEDGAAILWYTAASGEIQATVCDGKVAAVSTRLKQSASVISLQ